MRIRTAVTILFAVMVFTSSAWSQAAFTQKDREMLIELKTIVTTMEKRLLELREDMNKRFEQVDKRFEEMGEDMNKRFDQVDRRFEQVNNRFGDMDNRFGDINSNINSRFGEIMDYILILVTVFGAMTMVTIGFALWDRRSMVRPFESKVAELDKKISENRGGIDRLTDFLKKYALKNKRVAQLLHQLNLL